MGFEMPRDGQKVRLRLEAAALELYWKQGFELTRATEIAAEAGVTERTLFRHFSDKEDLIFEHARHYALLQPLETAVIAAPAAATSWEALRDALRSHQRHFVDHPLFAKRRALIRCTDALEDRDATRKRRLAWALAQGATHRGQPPAVAAFLGQLAVTTFEHAIDSWLENRSTDLDDHIVQAFHQVRDLLVVSSATGDTT